MGLVFLVLGAGTAWMLRPDLPGLVAGVPAASSAGAAQDRPPADIEYNRAFARRRVRVEHTIAEMRLYQAVTQVDRHHRTNHTARARAVAGLVNLRGWRLHAYRLRQAS